MIYTSRETYNDDIKLKRERGKNEYFSFSNLWRTRKVGPKAPLPICSITWYSSILDLLVSSIQRWNLQKIKILNMGFQDLLKYINFVWGNWTIFLIQDFTFRSTWVWAESRNVGNIWRMWLLNWILKCQILLYEMKIDTFKCSTTLICRYKYEREIKRWWSNTLKTWKE